MYFQYEGEVEEMIRDMSRLERRDVVVFQATAGAKSKFTAATWEFPFTA